MSIGFHIGEASNEISLLISLADLLAQEPSLFMDNVKIASYFGCPPVIWNGGRLMLGHFYPDRAQTIISAYNDRGIPYRFTFTNPHITKEHLNDRECNYLLDMADNGMNEVIVYSEVLEDYIRNKHPNMKITSSTCKCIRTIEDVKAELAKDYSLVVLDYNFNNDFEALEKLTPEERKRCEILSNPICLPDCPRRAAHYDYIGKIQLEKLNISRQYRTMTDEIRKKHGMEEWNCEYRSADPFRPYNEKLDRLRVTPESVYEKYAPMGFEHFKLEGRGSNIVNVCESVVKYMVKPEKRQQAAMMLLTNAIDYGFLNF